jgi:hypothetical protein
MSLLAKKHADEIRDMWQSKALRESRGLMRKVVITALAKEYPTAIIILLKVTFPDFKDIDRPLLASYAHIAIDGSVRCDIIGRDGKRTEAVQIFESEIKFLYELRKLADSLKLSDFDRTQMFMILQKWVAADKRVGVMGQKLAS